MYTTSTQTSIEKYIDFYVQKPHYFYEFSFNLQVHMLSGNLATSRVMIQNETPDERGECV
jgi:hypothetical protein